MSNLPSYDRKDRKEREWAVERFLELGFTPEATELLVDWKADWHEAENLLKNGCPRDLVLSILKK